MNPRHEPSVLGVFAHPDDESLFAGGFLARAASRGARTGVVTTTWSRATARGDDLALALAHLGAGEPAFWVTPMRVFRSLLRGRRGC